MGNELLPCPFCGGVGYSEWMKHGDYGKVYFIACRSCACEGPWSKFPEGAVIEWNRRVDTRIADDKVVILVGQTLRDKAATWEALSKIDGPPPASTEAIEQEDTK